MSGTIAVAAAGAARLIAQFAALVTVTGGTLFALGGVGQARISDVAQPNRSDPSANVSIQDGCPAVGRISADLETRRANEVVSELSRSPWFQRSVLHDVADRWVEGSTVVAYSPCHPDRPVDTRSDNPGVAVVVDSSRTYRVVLVNVP